MNELFNFLDKDLRIIKDGMLYKKYFTDIDLIQDNQDVYYLSNYAKGIELVLSLEKIVQSIHLFGENRKLQKSFKGELPFGINFSFSRQKIRSLLGQPQRFGGAHQNILLGVLNVWDKYFLPQYSIRFEYLNNEQEICLITIASLTLETAFNIGLQ